MTLLPNRSFLPEWIYLVSLLSGQVNSEPIDISLEKLLLLAKSNNMLLAVGDKLKLINHSNPFPGDYETYYQRAKSIEKNTQQLIPELLTLFEKAGLPLLTIKSFLPFPYADSNIDVVIVESNKLDAYNRILQEQGFRHWFSLADWREPKKKNYFWPQQVEKDKAFPMLHLHRAISWNGIEYLDLSRVWARHRMADVGRTQVPVPSFEDEVLIMAAHAIFENKYITLNDLIYLQWLTAQSLDWDYIVKSAELFFWNKALNLFFFTVSTLAQSLKLDLKIDINILPCQNQPTLPLPYLLPLSQTFSVSWHKLGHDIIAGNWYVLPRQVFSYTFVDGVWMYRKAWRKRQPVRKIQ